LVGIALLEAEAGEDLLGARLERVVDVVVVVVLRLEFLAAGGDVEDGLVADGGAFLRQVAEVGAAFPLDGALVGLLLAEDEVEERGLARAIGPDQAEAVGARDEERDVGKQFAGAVGLGNVGDGEHGEAGAWQAARRRRRTRRAGPSGRGRVGAALAAPSG
jgi:hypothetical protein